jgi:hypothetical protein
MILALPAFALGAVIVGLGSRVGISEFATFMVSVPVLICAWLYFAGWLVDRWRDKRRARNSL